MNNERKAGGFSLFALWFGAAVSLAEIMTGGLIAPLGIKNGIIAIVLGHLIGCMMLAAAGFIGFKEGKPSLVSSRMALGKYGSYLISIFNLVQLIGWTAIMLIQCTKSLQPITGRLFGFDNFALLTITAGILVAVWAINADKGINVVNNVAVILLAILSLVILSMVLKNGQPAQMTGAVSFGTALELSIVMPLSWLPLIADYTRAGKTAKGSMLGSFTGYFLGSSLMYVIGLLAAIYTGASDMAGIMSALKLGYSALLVIIFATVTTTFMDVYSAVMSTLNLSQGLSRKGLIIIYTALGTFLALFFPMEEYESFLYMIGSLFAPVFSVIIADYFVFRADRSETAVNVLGIISAAVGTAVYYIIQSFDPVTGLSIPAIAATLVVYFGLRFGIKAVGKGEGKHA